MADSKSGIPAPSNPPGPERRQAPRVYSVLKIICFPAGAGLSERRQARVRNVSRTGIGLQVDRHWESGTLLHLELPLEEGTRLVRARVVHATPQYGLHLVGCSFEVPLTDAQVEQLTR
jgi:hypothetical protein